MARPEESPAAGNGLHAVLDVLLDHNRRATDAVLDACETLDSASMGTGFEIGPGSLHDTLVHLVGAMGRWADRIAEGPLRPSPEEDHRPRTVDEIRSLLAAADADLRAVVRSSGREDRLDDVLSLRFPGLDRPIPLTRAAAIAHVLTHGVHHRAQAVNMLRRLGVEPLPEVDVVTAALLRSARASGADV